MSLCLLLSKYSLGSLLNLLRIYGNKVVLVPISEYSAINEGGKHPF